MSKQIPVGELPPVTVQSHEPHKVILELAMSEDLPAFSGHFPSLPVLPGVVQLHWAIALSGQHFAITGQAQNVDALKFQNIISPHATLRLVLERLDTQKVAFQYLVNDVRASSGRITFIGE